MVAMPSAPPGSGVGRGCEGDGVDMEAGLLEERAVVRGRGVEAGGGGFSVDAVRGEGGLEGGADGGDVAEATHFRDETATRAQGAMD